MNMGARSVVPSFAKSAKLGQPQLGMVHSEDGPPPCELRPRIGRAVGIRTVIVAAVFVFVREVEIRFG